MLSIKRFFNNQLKFSKFNPINNGVLNNFNLLKCQRVLFSSVYVNHRDTVDNDDNTPFDFTSENYKEIDRILVIIHNFNMFL